MDVSSASALAPIPFTSSPAPTLGVEIELQIVDPSTHNLKQGSVDLLERICITSPSLGPRHADPGADR